MKLKLALLMSVTLMFLLCACSNKDDSFTLADDFSNYVVDNYDTIAHSNIESDIKLLILPSGNAAFSGRIQKETSQNTRSSKITSKYGHDNIVAIELYSDGNTFKNFIINSSIDDLKNDIRYYGDVFIEYANNKEWNNDYYLLLTLWIECNTIVYDYEKNIIYLPKDIDTYIEMYSLFNTIDVKEISEINDGNKWLVENGFATIKHNQIELINNSQYRLMVVGGEFSEFNDYNMQGY